MATEGKNPYKKRYKMNIVGREGLTTTVAIPPEVVEKQAADVGLTTEQFIKQYRAVAQYNGFDGVLYTFEPRLEEGKPNSK